MIESLLPQLVIALAESILPSVAKHHIDSRASARAFGRPLYERFVVGDETRTRDRLLAENPIGIGKLILMASVGGWLLTTSVAAILIAGAYLLKCALGTDLMEDDSILHQFFFA